MCRGIVNKIIPFSSVDGPGNRTAIFLQGCNLNCLYCHNPETINFCNHCGMCISSCPYNALWMSDGKVMWDEKECKKCDKCLKICPNDSTPKTVEMTVGEVLDVVKKTRDFISGVTISGGESMLKYRFITELFKEVKKMGLTTFIDSNGTIPFYDKSDLLNVMDMAMIDLKSFDIKEHERLTGLGNKTTIENIKFLADINKLYEVRTVIVPEILNNHYNIDMISKLIASVNPDIRYKIIRYRPLGVRTEMIDIYSPTDELMNKLRYMAEKNGLRNVIVV